MAKAAPKAPNKTEVLKNIAEASGLDKKDVAKARQAFDRALEDAHASGKPQTVKRTLTEYADFLANQGDHKAAFELSREALATSR